MKARIIKIVSKEYTLLTDQGERLDAIVMGKVRRQDAPVAGDLVESEFVNGRWVIQKILPRRNRLIRPAVANVDQALIIMSVKDPDFSPALIDRLSILIMHAGIQPILCVTKCDLGISPDFEERIREYEAGEMPVIRTAKGSLDPSLASLFSGRITVLTGQSGAGKSTLLNELEPSFHLATQEISKALGRGRHTTRHNELHEVCGGLVADTPGFSSIDFSHIEARDLAACVPDFVPYLGGCRFNDCIHENEPGCSIMEAVAEGKICRVRYENYLQVLEMIRQRK
ncbi:MAG: ribosome small subunit-dependent GTPase A, partial [Solobacterium sp.]|nr:ribosome small subunit-dependent GTPase A [Solobacterium sp.]